MRAAELALFYLLVGGGLSVVLAVERRRLSLLDTALLIPFWPLVAPFMLGDRLRPRQVALRGPELWLGLGERVRVAEARIEEIGRLLTQPEFSAEAAGARASELRTAGDPLGAAAAEGRLANIRRMEALRTRLTREVAGVRELIDQLKVQAELIRLSGEAESQQGMSELVVEAQARIEALDLIVCDHRSATDC
jgi:hypothetical protein